MLAYQMAGSIAAALNSVIQIGRARIEELAVSGFATEQAYDTNFFRLTASKGGAFRLVSLTTGTHYDFVIKPGVVREEFVQVILVGINREELKRDNRRKLTLTRGDNGQILAHPGWRS